MDQDKLHVAIISSPGMGHLVPVLLLGNRIATHHDPNVTILAVTTESSPVESHLISSFMDKNVNIIKVLLPDMSDLLLPEDTVFTHLVVMMREARQGIRSAIFAMEQRPDVIIADMFSTESLPIADEFHMQKYIFSPVLARTVSLVTYLPVLDKEVEGQYVERIDPLIIPGCVPLQCENVPDPMLDRNNREYHEYVRMGDDFTSLPNGILINTWRDMDPTSLDALKYNETLRSLVKVPIYDIGPLTREVDPNFLKGNKVIEWLDMQPLESVLFVSFGSGGTHSLEQITELAWGLELSQQRFVWVVRPPPASITSEGAYFVAGGGGGPNESGPSCFLPKGFLTRNEKLGLVVPLWAPQVEILNHRSIGGFLSHCGVSSVCESITSGVPMIAWPLHAEQRLNAATLAEEVKVAIRPVVLPANKVVRRDEIEKMVRSLMKGEEGKTMREKVKLLRESAKEALGINGSSYNSMCELIQHCEMKKSVQGDPK